MKNIIFRVDYQGVVDVQDTVKNFLTAFQGKFGSYTTTFHNTVDIDINDIEEISDTLSIPVREIQRQVIHRFEENKFGDDKVRLDISKYYTVMSIDCLNYKNIDPYLDFFVEFNEFLYRENEYIEVKRIGLRKIGGKIFFNVEDIYKDFEKRYFYVDFSHTPYHIANYHYTDLLQIDEVSPRIRFVRTMQKGVYNDGDEEKDAYQVLMDLDAFFDINILSAVDFNIGMLKKLLKETNHNHLFDLFKMSVTEEFLNQNKND